MSKYSTIKEYKVNGVHIITYPTSYEINNGSYGSDSKNMSGKELEYLIWSIIPPIRYGPFNTSGDNYCIHKHSDDKFVIECNAELNDMYEDAKKTKNLSKDDSIFLDELYAKRENTKSSECDGCAIIKNNNKVVAIHCDDCRCKGCISSTWYYKIYSS